MPGILSLHASLANSLPAYNPAFVGANIALSVGNTVATKTSGGAWSSVLTTPSPVVPVRFRLAGGSNFVVGIGNSSADLGNFPGFTVNSVGLNQTGDIYTGGSSFTNVGFTFAASDIIGSDYDASGNRIRFNKNGGAYSSYVSVSGVTGTRVLMSGLFDTSSSQTIQP